MQNPPTYACLEACLGRHPISHQAYNAVLRLLTPENVTNERIWLTVCPAGDSIGRADHSHGMHSFRMMMCRRILILVPDC
jgi:hypothetical protein